MTNNPEEKDLRLPTHRELQFPLLRIIEELGGAPRARDAIEAVSEALDIPDEIRKLQCTTGDGRKHYVLGRRLRWTREDLCRRGFVSKEKYNRWELTEAGANHLDNCRPGVIITVYETANGTALWATAETASAVIGDGTINLILTSPPYPLNKQKSYKNLRGQEYLDWLVGLTSEWRRMLVDDGSLVLNLADVWNRGEPTVNLYQERLLIKLVDELGWFLAQRFQWINYGKIPSSEWVTVRKVRVKNVTENLFWLSKTPWPRTSVHAVRRAYSERMKKLIAQGGEYRALRPSGHGDTRGAFGRDNGGSIPFNIIEASNSASSDAYHRRCREHGLPAHPARFPRQIPRFFIELLTERGHKVYDPFYGSGETGAAAEELGREWLGSERSLKYLSGSKFKFDSYDNTAPWLCPI